MELSRLSGTDVISKIWVRLFYGFVCTGSGLSLGVVVHTARLEICIELYMPEVPPVARV